MALSPTHREMLSLEEARSLVLSLTQALPTEIVPTLDAVGRVAACDLFSDIDVYPFPHASMDGFAIRTAELAAASPEHPVELDVVAEVAAGDVFEGTLGPGQCIRIMTGGCLPAETDAVVKYEITTSISRNGLPGGRVSFTSPAKAGENIRPAGEEARAGECVVQAGEVIHAAGVGFLAGCGILDIPTYRRPRVAVISTGSELVDSHETPPKGKIRNSNTYALAACVQAVGGIPVTIPSVADDLELLKSTVLSAANTCDAVVTTGGASNGDFDFIKRVVEQLGVLHVTTVNMRPGKSQTFGLINDVPIFGLPGNPAAAYVGFELIVRPALRKMQGYAQFNRPTVSARLSSEVIKKDIRRNFMRATVSKDEAGYLVTPAKNQSSGLFGTIQRCNCVIDLPAGSGSYPVGTPFDCIMLNIPEETIL